MTKRIQDPRVLQAQAHGIIVGMPKAFVETVAVMADVLSDCRWWSDVTLMFDGQVTLHGPGTFRVPVEGKWWIVFEWEAPWGAVEIRLHEQ